VVRPNTLTFISGLMLAGATGAVVHWYDRAKRLQDAIEYMVDAEIDDADEALRAWSGEDN
jgi:hypothetical protein